MMKLIKIGVDPGLGGAIAMLDADNRLLEVEDMPVMAMPVVKQKNQINAAALYAILQGWVFRGDNPLVSDCTVYLESATAMPKQGVTSMFSFGMSFGIVQGVVAAMGLPLVIIKSQEWKKRAGIIGKAKDASRTLAQQLYPTAKLSRMKDHGRADAILIARFAILPRESHEHMREVVAILEGIKKGARRGVSRA